MSDTTDYRSWWEQKWTERETLLRAIFGDTSPSGTVVSFTWTDLRSMIPGGCALIFPPDPPSRDMWLTITHGLTQPESPEEEGGDERPSGFGYEFGLLTNGKHSWATKALSQMMSYIGQGDSAIGRGHRVPMWYYRDSNTEVIPVLGQVEPNSIHLPCSEMRAMLFWPYMSFPSGFSTSTGYFSILAGITITKDEWEMARATSSAHLLVLLFQAGIGQRSDLDRQTITNDKVWAGEWKKVSRLSEEDAEEELLNYSGRD